MTSSTKRTWSAYEREGDAAPFALYGSPLPDSQNDRGAFVPLHLQEARDEKGRRRFHGAFTGGWSAGYFNTVGSKEGWKPSTFVSSRTDRANQKQDSMVGQRPEDFMDEEDLQDSMNSRQLESSDQFSAMGMHSGVHVPHHLVDLGIFLDESIGARLMGKMGWKPGQGTGPKVRRAARLQMDSSVRDGNTIPEYLFAPDDVVISSIIPKTDRQGLGIHPKVVGTGQILSDLTVDDSISKSRVDMLKDGSKSTSQHFEERSAPLIGVSLEDDSDEDLGPRISYVKAKSSKDLKRARKKQTTSTVVKPTAKRNPRALVLGSGDCKTLPGFVIALRPMLSNSTTTLSMYTPPIVPEGWVSSLSDMKESSEDSQSFSALFKPSSRERGAALGETQLPGKSIFDFITPESRAKLALVSGNCNLPPARGETLPRGGSIMTIAEIYDSSPVLGRESALAALARASIPGGPYINDEAKLQRYLTYLRVQAKQRVPSEMPSGMSIPELQLELAEFFNCARIFKPMTGFMASRFAPSSGGKALASESEKQATPKVEDSATEAAKLGMYGHLTRSYISFSPARLLYKRFNIPVPPHVKADEQDKLRASIIPVQATEPPEVSKDSSPEGDGVAAGDLGVPGRPTDDVFQAIFGED